MGRFLLDDSALREIAQELPELDRLQEIVLGLAPDFISIKVSYNSDIPVVAVCLQDTLDALSEARYALSECLAHRMWYLEKLQPSNETAAAFFSRFYADDVALRLYSAGEHLANAIVFMLEITKEELKSYKARGISHQGVVGNYLIKEKPGHPITEVIAKLASSEEWRASRTYRDKWVHEHPPTMENQGIVYHRRKRWKRSKSDKGWELGIGGWDKPEYSVQDLIGFVQAALLEFTDAATAVAEFYAELLSTHGIVLGEKYSMEIRDALSPSSG